MRVLSFRVDGAVSGICSFPRFLSLTCVSSLLLAAGVASAASTSFSGTLIDVSEPGGSATTPVFTGAAVDDRFFGNFVYGNIAGLADSITMEPNEVDWEFIGAPWSAFLNNGSVGVSGSEVYVNIQDDKALDAEEAAFVSDLLGFNVAEGTLADVWSVGALSTGAFEQDLDLTDNDDTEELFNGSLFELAYLSLDTDTIANLSYNPNPPALSEVDIAIFSIQEADAAGDVIFDAIGIVDTTVIPVPAAIWLFGSALGLLGWTRRKAD